MSKNPSRNILIFSALYRPSMGGVETYTHNLAKKLTEMGNSVTVVTMNSHNGKEIESEDKVKVVRLPCHALLSGRYPIPKQSHSYRTLLKEIERTSYDGIIVNTRFYPMSIVGLRMAKQKNLKALLIEHGSAHLCLNTRIENDIIAGIEHFFSLLTKLYNPMYYGVSRKASEWLGHFGIQSNGELPNAIDADCYLHSCSDRNFRKENDIDEKAFVVAVVSRLIPEKGILELRGAAEMLSGRNIHFLVAGSGSLETVLATNSPSNFHLLGRLNREDLVSLYRQSDVYCLPSRSEGFATTLLESAACGTPAIVTDVGGARELIPSPEFGTIIDNMRPETISEAISFASENKAQIQQQGNAVAKLVRKEYGWEQTARMVIKAFN